VTSFLLAIQFLTRLPVPLHLKFDDKQLGLSVLYYPLIGALIGTFLLLFALFAAHIALPVQAALVLIIWVAVTGGLHLDGLADCADAWAGGLNNRERSLEIMKDPRVGAIAVICLILVLLLKWTALTEILATSHFSGLIIAPLLGRAAILGLMLSTPYLRKQGLGLVLNHHFPKSGAKIVLLSCVLISFYSSGFLPVFFAILMLWAIRNLALQRLGGVTGDVYGAAVELIETSVLTALVF
jgi:adenosylcobinamide-GDP ribazoletransferase